MVNRILRDDPSKGAFESSSLPYYPDLVIYIGDMHNRQALSIKSIGRCLADYHMWPLYLVGLSWLIPNNPM